MLIEITGDKHHSWIAFTCSYCRKTLNAIENPPRAIEEHHSGYSKKTGKVNCTYCGKVQSLKFKRPKQGGK